MFRFIMSAAAMTLAVGVAHAGPQNHPPSRPAMGAITNTVDLTQLGQVNFALIGQGRNVNLGSQVGSYLNIDNAFNVRVAPGAVNAMSILGTAPVNASVNRPVDIDHSLILVGGELPN